MVDITITHGYSANAYSSIASLMLGCLKDGRRVPRPG